MRGEAKPRRSNLRNFVLFHEIATLSSFARNDVDTNISKYKIKN
ncbi:hypothetical protein [Rickettsia felis]|nr:hypothetical protein [Rickettsia felis]